ncbi:GH1 family beta-glucosidase [Nocardioides bruguierae]|uniref:GH1 family beta-glucosidase n=1 Tax=Nocardioides bruguierae TaxID=2945102 RepID=UPI002021F995|nr:GH1 family beta-glucosidase [Nocardioides bruguierae]MCL8024099.1 GH1 family beta-glucosidase [Nocardioides bruguierae]
MPPSQDAPRLPPLPPGFRLGVATAAYQVEGAPEAEGRGPSVWDTFAARPGAVAGGLAAGDLGADHYRRFREDVSLLADLGVDAYRFSISWSRVQPSGRGAPNAAGLDHYERLVDTLLKAGIDPVVTLFHGDLPQGLEDDGGWLNRETISRFGDYAALVGERLADRVSAWVPVDEPNVVAFLGYGTGSHAPGRRLMFHAIPVAHHLLIGHGVATSALRAAGAERVGCANHHAPMWPASDDEADVGATKLFDSLWNGFFIEPMLLGRYPRDLEILLDDVIEPGDLALIRQPLDFYGISYYAPMRIAAAPEEAETPFMPVPLLGYPTTDLGWPVVPDALREWLITFRARYRAALPPLCITAAGAAYADTPDEQGVVDDDARIAYLDGHLRAVSAAVQRGVDVQGMFVWSLLDGFDGAQGYQAPFGLVRVEPGCKKRVPKASFDWFHDVIASRTRSIG